MTVILRGRSWRAWNRAVVVEMRVVVRLGILGSSRRWGLCRMDVMGGAIEREVRGTFGLLPLAL